MSNSNALAGMRFGGVGFWGLLQIAFIVLKLCHKIDWRWRWVLAPTWVEMGLVALIILMVIIIAFLSALAQTRRESRR